MATPLPTKIYLHTSFWNKALKHGHWGAEGDLEDLLHSIMSVLVRICAPQHSINTAKGWYIKSKKLS